MCVYLFSIAIMLSEFKHLLDIKTKKWKNKKRKRLMSNLGKILTKAVINSNKYIENSLHIFCWFYNSTKEISSSIYTLLNRYWRKRKKPIHLHKYNKIIQDVALHEIA